MKSIDPKSKMAPHRQVIEEIIAEKLEHITILLDPGNVKKSQIYSEVIEVVERCLFKIALKRNNYIKSKAADYLGMNRNTFHKKMGKLHLDNDTHS